MFPLSGTDFPGTSEELARSIRDALADVLTLPGNNSTVTAEGGKYPVVEKLTVNLSGAIVSATVPPPKCEPTGNREPGIDVGQLEVLGHPITYGTNKLDLAISAKDVHFDFGRDK